MGERVDNFEYEQRALAERCLSEVDNLNRLRQPDGRHARDVLEAMRVNILTAVKETAMPYAVSTTHQEYRDGEFWWLDQTPRQVAESGYRFHQHPAALRRVDVEVAEAIDIDKNLQPGRIKISLSPRMTERDAPHAVAKRENLADADMVRIHMLDVDDGELRGKFMQSVLVRDIPLAAWVALLRDPQNIFGGAVDVRDDGSALSVMQVHDQLEAEEAVLPEGVVSVIEAVIPYIADASTRAKVIAQTALFRMNQEEMHRAAEAVADRWLDFEVALSDSLHTGWAQPVVERFTYQLQHEWGSETLQLLEAHTLPNGRLRMSRELAVKLEQARQNTLQVAAAVAAGNEEVIAKLGYSQARQVYENEMLIQTMMTSGYSAAQIAAIEAHNNRTVAQSGVTTGGGCMDEAIGDFNRNPQDGSDAAQDPRDRQASKKDGRERWKWKMGKCRIAACPSRRRPEPTKIGPCAVCAGCQRIYDRGGDPFKLYGGEEKMPDQRQTVAEGIKALLEVTSVSQEAPSVESAQLRRSQLALAA